MIIAPDKILIEEYNYFLPAERIAHYPLPERDSSKVLIYQNGSIIDEQFFSIPSRFAVGDLLVLNNTKVIEARLLFQKQSGGIIEIFCLQPHQQSMETALQQTHSVQWKCLIGGASKWKAGQALSKSVEIDGKNAALKAVYEGKADDSFIIRFEWEPGQFSFVEMLHVAGAIPLPPYIKRGAEEIDAERYQTIFGKQEGSVAAPTAALHFTEKVFDALKAKGVEKTFVTLNVGAGTFKPVKSLSIAEHQMHGEDFSITKTAIEKILDAERVIAVGTTSLRTIESVYWLGVKLASGILKNEWAINQWEVYDLNNTIHYKESLNAILKWMNERGLYELHCRTSLLIVPGYQFKIPSGIITNFHQPQSTLLLLIAAFIGDDWKKVYQHALDNNYRFLSYGDSSLLWKK